MTVKELINLLKTYNSNTKVITPNGMFYSNLTEDEIMLKDIYSDFSDVDETKDNSVETETCLLISTNQFN